MFYPYGIFVRTYYTVNVNAPALRINSKANSIFRVLNTGLTDCGKLALLFHIIKNTIMPYFLNYGIKLKNPQFYADFCILYEVGFSVFSVE